jgi:DNA-binding CsgD family transcriptional regulator
MIDDEQEFSRLLGDIYDAAGDPTLWTSFIEGLAGRTKSTSAALVIQAYDQDLYSVSSSWQLPEEFDRAYREYYHSLDIWAKVVVPEPGKYLSGCAYTSQSLCPDRQMKKTEFYNDLLVTGGIEHAMFALVENNESCVAAVCCYRDKSSVEFGERDLKFLRLLAPHLRRAFGLHLKFSKLKARNESVETALDMLPTGVIFFDCKGQIILMNQSAAACVAERDGLLATPTGLRAGVPAESLLLRKTIQDAAATSGGNGMSAGGLVVVSRRVHPPLQVQISPIRNSALPTSRAAVAVAFITDPLRTQRPTREILRIVFGLTPAECRLALLLSDGKSPREICNALGVGENTVRSQIKSIFSKTGVNRQSELVRLLIGHARAINDPA